MTSTSQTHRSDIHSNRKRLTVAVAISCGFAITVIASALAFEHIGGYQPCKLCLEQREPWYLAIPILAIASLSSASKWPACVTRGALAIASLAMAYSLVLGVNHAGVEWSWWQGPDDCGAVEGGIAANSADFLKQLESGSPPSCDSSTLRVLGLSFAGWNALVSLILLGFLAWTLMAYERLQARPSA